MAPTIFTQTLPKLGSQVAPIGRQWLEAHLDRHLTAL